MGKPGSSRSPRPDIVIDDASFGVKDYQIRLSETGPGSDPSLGRRILGGECHLNKTILLHGLNKDTVKCNACKGVYGGKRQIWLCRHLRPAAFTIGLMGLFFLLDSLMFSNFDSVNLHSSSQHEASLVKDVIHGNQTKSSALMYEWLLNVASGVLAEKQFKHEGRNLWKEPYQHASAWKPCAHGKSREDKGIPPKSNGFVLVSANGGLNQQRVAICNIVAVASLLNATLVIPRFLFSNVWKDPRGDGWNAYSANLLRIALIDDVPENFILSLGQFGDIYQEDYFINSLKDDVTIVKELPPHLKSLDLEAIGSLITDSDLVKEAKPDDYIGQVLPLLSRNGVVHFLGYGNRLGFDPIPSRLQKLRCKCNFHALKFVPRIQETGSLLIRRIRRYDWSRNMLDKQLLGNFMPDNTLRGQQVTEGPSKYLALHLRFEVDMVAYSLCEFGGGENEKKELQAYRETHFPLLIERLKTQKPLPPAELRLSGRCPLTPEEAALVLAGLGFKHGTYIYLAGSHIYGGQSRMQPFTSLYPNLVTKEDLLTPSELEPFKNFSSQMAALDFIACATADVFAMTDSGSQLSSLVSGFRTYFGGGNAPTLRPNKKRFAAIMLENRTIEWKQFGERVKKMIEEAQRVQPRGYGRSIYRQPRSPECMCKSQ